MAAKLKKRALAEYQSQVELSQEEEQQKKLSKKLKLLIPARRPSSTGSQASSTPTRRVSTADSDTVPTTPKVNLRDVLDSIVTASPAILSRTLEPTKVVELVKKLCRALQSQPAGFFSSSLEDGSSRIQIYLCLKNIIDKYPEQDVPIAPELCDEWLSQLKQEESKKVKASLLTLLATWVSNRRVNSATQTELLSQVRNELMQQSHLVKRHALHVLGRGTHVLSAQDRSVATSILATVNRHTKAQDPRVRQAAYEALLDIHENGNKLDSGTFKDLCSALDDDYEGVRVVGLRLIHTMAMSYPEESIVEGDGDGTSLRLIDDAFGKICNAVQDLSVRVREMGIVLIGSMDSVSPEFLAQTLDKKLMSNMRTKKSAHERQARMVASGEWSSGQKWADDAPREEVDADSVSLMSFGACGAFIHGLEDEFMAVRSSAIESLTLLSMKHPDLAHTALDFIVDMFNDEIEAVRLKAIESLTRIANHITLKPHQLEPILWALDDSSIMVREKLHEMLQASAIATKDGLQSVINKLLENLKRYPQDKRSIHVTCKKLGTSHAHLVLPLVTQLLEIHPFFDTPEPDIEDPAYLCILVLVINAAHHCPTLGPLLDEHTKRHFRYLEDTYPHLTPNNNNAYQPGSNGCKVVETNTDQFVRQVMQTIETSASRKIESRMKVLAQACKDLEKVSEIEPSISDAATFMKLYIKCQYYMLKSLMTRFWANGIQVGQTQQGDIVSNNIKEMLKLCLQLENGFTNLTSVHKKHIKTMRLQTFALHLVFLVRASNKSALHSTERLLKEMDSIKREFETGDSFTMDGFLKDLVSSLPTDEKERKKPGVIVKILQPLLLKHQIEPIAFDSNIKMARVDVYEPQGNNETPLKYTAGMILAVPVDCELRHVNDTSLVRIAIHTPDQKIVLVTPKASDFIPKSDGTTRLLANALMSHQVWSEAMHVELRIVLDLASSADSVSSQQGGAVMNSLRSNFDSLVSLSDPIKVYVLPKAVKRGI